MSRHLPLVAVAFLYSVHAAGDVANSIRKMQAGDSVESSIENDRRQYRPPTGLGQYSWNTPLSEFHKLQPDPVYVRIVYFDGKTSNLDMDCFQSVGLLSQCSETEGAGFHAMAEYYVDGQGFRVTDLIGPGKTVMFPITYQFCAQWNGFSNNIAGDMLQRMRLCGVRLHYRSETAVQEASIGDPDHVTSSQRVLNWLIDNHGEPEHFVRRGRVTVVGVDLPREVTARSKRYDNWFWCQPKVDDVLPKCDASIVFTFDSETGRGQVIFLTPPVWAYAYARQYGGSEGDPLYRILHGGMEAPPVRHICTGTFLCEPAKPEPMSEKMMARFRLPAK